MVIFNYAQYFNLNLPHVRAVIYDKTFKNLTNNHADYSDSERYYQVAAL